MTLTLRKECLKKNFELIKTLNYALKNAIANNFNAIFYLKNEQYSYMYINVKYRGYVLKLIT